MTRVVCVLAPNPGPFTLEGTNTWVVGTGPAAVIDPGPDDEAHLSAVAAEAESVAAILLTHRHPDHAPGARRLAGMVGAPVLAYHPEPGEQRLRDGQRVEVGGDPDGGSDSVRRGTATIRAVHTPGHTTDHVAFLLEEDRSLFTGDAVLGWGTSIVDPDEGDLATYLRSLEVMRALRPHTIHPGHGPVVEAAMEKLDEYREHRALRERQIVEALRGGEASAADLVPLVYAETPAELHPAAARQALSHLLKLEAEGRVRRRPGSSGSRFELAGPG